MTATVHSEIEVCQCCMLVHANGECCDQHGADFNPTLPEPLALWWGDETIHLALGGEELGYSTSRCEGCGTYTHGDRYAMTVFYSD